MGSDNANNVHIGRRKSVLERVEGVSARLLTRLPAGLVRRATGAPVERDGHVLDVHVQLTLKVMALIGRKLPHESSVEASRAELEATSGLLAPSTPPLRSVSDAWLETPTGRIRARFYYPIDAPAKAPALVFFHGGGWVLGSLDTHDAPCRAIATRCGCVVIAVDYRLAPEHPFPAAVDDALGAFRAIASATERYGLDPDRLLVGGDSAGGNLAAIVSLETRNDVVRPRYQLLVYPVTDATMSSASYRSCREGFFLEAKTMQWFFGHYLPPGFDLEHPRVSPLFVEDVRGAPPAFILTAGFDPLRDEGEAYADKLRKAGVEVRMERYGSLIHGFFNVSGGIAAAREAFDDIVGALHVFINARSSPSSTA